LVETRRRRGEVCEAFENPNDPVKLHHSAVVPGSYLAYGRTLAGRYLLVALWPKGEGRINIATARDMTDAERALYKRK